MFGSQRAVVVEVLGHSPKGGGPPKWYADVVMQGNPRPDTEEETVARTLMGDVFPKTRRIPLFRLKRLEEADGLAREG